MLHDIIALHGQLLGVGANILRMAFLRPVVMGGHGLSSDESGDQPKLFILQVKAEGGMG